MVTRVGLIVTERRDVDILKDHDEGQNDRILSNNVSLITKLLCLV